MGQMQDGTGQGERAGEDDYWVIEKLAEHLYGTWKSFGNHDEPFWRELNESKRHTWRKVAKAAVKAVPADGAAPRG